MVHFEVDYSVLDKKVANKIYRLSDVKHRLEKVAFDVVRFKDGDPEELWQIQSADDGEFVVARYDTEDVKEAQKATTAADWNVLVNKISSDINIFYKGRPITKIAASQLGIDLCDMETVQRFLPAKLASDKAFTKAFINSLDATTKSELLKLYPELS